VTDPESNGLLPPASHPAKPEPGARGAFAALSSLLALIWRQASWRPEDPEAAERARREELLDQLITTLVGLVDRCDPFAADHSHLVGHLSGILAQ